MKKLLSILLAALCALLPLVASAQQNTTLKASIPSIHRIQVNCGEHGSVTILNGDYSGAFTIDVPRLGSFDMTAKPDSGYAVMQIQVGDLDGVTIEGGQISFNGVHCDNSVKISFYELDETPVPSATPTNTPKPTPTATAEPADTESPSPTTTAEPADTESPSPTTTAEPADTESPSPTMTAGATDTPKPSATASTKPTASSTVKPTVKPTVTPQPTNGILGAPSLADSVSVSRNSSTSNVLYDEYLGTGEGLDQLNIVFNGARLPKNYRVLTVGAQGEAANGSLLVRAEGDEPGQSSLVLSAMQLIKLAQKQVGHLTFENGEALTSLDLIDLLGGKMQKLLGLIYDSGDIQIAPEILNGDFDAIEAVELPEAELARMFFEMRIVPIEEMDGSAAYEISLWLHWGDTELNVSSLVDSLRVHMNVETLVNNENEADFTRRYAVAHRTPQAEGYQPLESSLEWIPAQLPADMADVGERFLVSIPEDGGNAITVYEAEAQLDLERRIVLSADYAGEGAYRAQLIT